MNRLRPMYKLINSTWNLEQMVLTISAEKINLSPIYQRGDVWEVAYQKQFIQNMVNGFPFGSIILNRNEDTDDIMYLECVDGKQRITAMHDYCNNKFSINVNGEELFYEDLAVNEIRKLHNIGVPVYYVYNLSTADCMKLFLDLNSSVPQSTEHMIYVTELYHEQLEQEK